MARANAPRFVPVRRRSGLMSRCGEPDKHQTLSGAASCLKIRSRSWPHSTHSKTEKVECFDQGTPHGRDWWGNGGLRTVKAAGDRTRPCGRQRSRRSSSFLSVKRFRNGGLVGTAMALFVGFLEQAAAHAAEFGAVRFVAIRSTSGQLIRRSTENTSSTRLRFRVDRRSILRAPVCRTYTR